MSRLTLDEVGAGSGCGASRIVDDFDLSAQNTRS